MIQQLLDLGLTLNEAKIYLGFLKYGETTAADMSRKLSMDKSSVYRGVDNLVSNQLLITNYKVKGTTYVANEPSILNNLFERKRKEFEDKSNNIKSLVNSLKSSGRFTPRETSFKIERGIDAHLLSMEDSLKENKDKLILEKWEMDNPIFLNKEYEIYVKKFAVRRIKLGIQIHTLTDLKKTKSNSYPSLMKTSTRLLKEVRTYPDEVKDSNSFRVFKDTIEIISFDNNNDFIVITIKDKFLTSLMRTMYSFMWERSEVYNNSRKG